jgi:hypothetical protein
MTVEGKLEFRDIFKMTSRQWTEIGLKILKWRREDFDKGLFQNGRQKLPYKDKKYARYKANNMKRFTSGGQSKSFDPSHDYGGKRLYGSKSGTTDGDRLRRYAMASIQSTQSQFVDMKLTGTLIDGAQVSRVTDSSVEILVANKDHRNNMKVIGNRRYGREMNGLNDKNKRLVKVEILKMLNESLKKDMMKELTITVNG